MDWSFIALGWKSFLIMAKAQGQIQEMKQVGGVIQCGLHLIIVSETVLEILGQDSHIK